MSVPHQELIRRFEALVSDMKRGRAWGSITISFKEGDAHTIEKRETYSLNGAPTKGLPLDANKPQI